jgi:hypothetical protein
MPLTAAAAGVGFCTLCDRKRYSLDEAGLCRKCQPWTTRKAPPPLPPGPTHFLPGTPEKVEVMRDRDNRGYAVHHPDDATIEVDDLGLPSVAGGIQPGCIREGRVYRCVAG